MDEEAQRVHDLLPKAAAAELAWRDAKSTVDACQSAVSHLETPIKPIVKEARPVGETDFSKCATTAIPITYILYPIGLIIFSLISGDQFDNIFEGAFTIFGLIIWPILGIFSFFTGVTTGVVGFVIIPLGVWLLVALILYFASEGCRKIEVREEERRVTELNARNVAEANRLNEERGERLSAAQVQLQIAEGEERELADRCLAYRANLRLPSAFNNPEAMLGIYYLLDNRICSMLEGFGGAYERYHNDENFARLREGFDSVIAGVRSLEDKVSGVGQTLAMELGKVHDDRANLNRALKRLATISSETNARLDANASHLNDIKNVEEYRRKLEDYKLGRRQYAPARRY